jgi:hypothetical protein
LPITASSAGELLEVGGTPFFGPLTARVEWL